MQDNDNNWRSTTPTHYRSAFLREASEPISSPISTRRKIETETTPIQPRCLNIAKSCLRQKYENLIGNSFQGQILTLKDRNLRCNFLSQYLIISTPDIRPGSIVDSINNFMNMLEKACPFVLMFFFMKRTNFFEKKPIVEIVLSFESSVPGFDHHLTNFQRIQVKIQIYIFCLISLWNWF